jgi:hypothetical protein
MMEEGEHCGNLECELCNELYGVHEEKCRGCGKWGEVNYGGNGEDLQYYCGGSPWCCP